ncbi:MAG: OsmC family protein [Chloroflexi bacterium]|nr:OsmC family protein [Chloroflexota bacterium]
MAARVVGRSVGASFTTQLVTGRHSVIADEPRPVGEDLGPSPYELLLAALGACTSMTLLLYARRKEWPLTEVQVELSHDRVYTDDCESCEEDGTRIERVTRRIHLEGPLSEEQRERLAEIARRCPVHKSLEAAISIVDEVS